MTFPLPEPVVHDPQVQRNFDALAQFLSGTTLESLAQAGDIKMTARSTAPSGWLLCDGSAISRTRYAALFSAIGTTFGTGDGSTTFNVPDFRSRAPIGAGTGSGLTARSLAASGGTEPSNHPAITTGAPSITLNHTHSVAGNRNTAGGFAPTNLADPPSAGAFSTEGINSASAGADLSHTHAVAATGGDNMMPFRVVNFAVKT